ncbi:MAG: site-2 protease family protein [bacterium]|nr:site-2 protease family protein [bacterium]
MPISLILQQPAVGAAWVAAILVALAIHEFSHALVGTLLGDSTAKQEGRLTLNPLAHVDPLGFLMLLFVGFGWGRPVPFDPSQLRYRTWGPALVAMAGPAMNLLGVLVCGTLLAVLDRYAPLPPNNLFIFFLAFAFQMNIVLMLFNLIPIPPLDGSKVLLAALDRPQYDRARFLLETRGPMILLGIIILDSFAGGIVFSRLFRGAMDWIVGLF